LSFRVLLTNDDGIYAPGLLRLSEELKSHLDVTVVAPELEMSAVGHAITITVPLRVKEIHLNGGFFGYAVNGTPADCVKVALRAVMKDPPDVVISGINSGPNVATNVIYSGTVSAATEARILGFPSIAVSLDTKEQPDFSYAAKVALRMAKLVHEHGLPERTLLNVNVPAVPESEIRGFAVARQGISIFHDRLEARKDLKAQTYYWQGGFMGFEDADREADLGKLKENYVVVTPLQYNLTDFGFIDRLKTWRFD
jgi:5'-nucleotidase